MCCICLLGDNFAQRKNYMQKVINSWSDLMQVTGGLIATSKSWWYLIDVIWTNGKWSAVDAEADTSLTAPSHTGPVDLQRIQCDQTTEMLGIHMSPSGNKKTMLNHLRKEALQWAGKLRLGRTTPKAAWTALHTTISAKLKYAMPTSTFTQAECIHIIAPALAAGLQLSGVSRNFPTAARHAPITSGGLHVLDLHVDMGTSRTAALINYSLKNTPTGYLMKMNVEHLILEAGLYGTLWTMDMNKLAKYCTTSTWIFQTLKFNFDNDIELSLPHEHITPQRLHNKSIMSLALQYSSSSKIL